MPEERLELEILDRGIHCSGCEQRIRGSLARLRGVRSVEASQRTQKVSVVVDAGALTTKDVASALERLGYEVASE